MHPIEKFVNGEMVQYKADRDLGAAIRKTLEPFQPVGVKTAAAVAQLFRAHRNLSSPSQGLKFAQFAQLAHFYGINLRAFMATRAQAVSDVDGFAEDSTHPFFYEVGGRIAEIIATTGLSLPEAYEQAVWENPVTREKELKRRAAATDAGPSP